MMNAGGCRAVPRRSGRRAAPLARTVTLRPERLHMPDARGSGHQPPGFGDLERFQAHRSAPRFTGL